MPNTTPDNDAIRAAWVSDHAGLARQLIPPGSLVYDIGAHDGEHTLLYRSLGSDVRVLAVEPLVACAPELIPNLATGPLASDPLVTILDCAVSSECGERDFIVHGEFSYFSSLDARWISSSKYSRYFDPSYPLRTCKVRTRTLDCLIEEYGLPDYIKIDTEGHDDHVLRGLSRAIPLLSFEAHPCYIPQLQDCLAHVGSLARYEYNFVLNGGLSFWSEKWTEHPQTIRTVVASLKNQWSWADVYARRKE